MKSSVVEFTDTNYNDEDMFGIRWDEGRYDGGSNVERFIAVVDSGAAESVIPRSVCEFEGITPIEIRGWGRVSWGCGEWTAITAR